MSTPNLPRYFIFHSSHYYPSGGMGDLVGFAEELLEAQTKLQVSITKRDYYAGWWQIYDTKEQKVLSDGPPEVWEPLNKFACFMESNNE